MDKLYFFLLGIVVIAFIINILLVTKSSYPGSEVGVAPIIQAVLAIPLFLISATFFFFVKDIPFSYNLRLITLILPFILQLIYFTYTKDIFAIFKSDTGGFLTRSYIFAIGLSTITGILLAWVFGILTKK